jgi:L-histidine N-alpha-methyltransferase
MLSGFPARFREAVGSGATLVEAPGTRESRLGFARSVAAGLSDEPKWLHCRFLYDAEGSQLFEKITEQPEYYPTRTEAAILVKHAADIRTITGPRTLVELGSGYSVKTEHLLSAYVDEEDPLLYVPVDVSDTALREASKTIAEQFADVQFTGINGTYRSAFPVLRQLSPQMVIFLGSSIGNFNPAETTAFWRNIAGHLPAGDFLLLGIDLVKDVAVLEAAYNDAAGVTAAFTKNYFVRMNRELRSGIDIDQIEHVAIWNPELGRIEISVRFHTDQEIYIEPLDERFKISAGERILVEISRKYRLPEVTEELGTFGFEARRAFTDEKEWFALLLLERTDDSVLRRPPYSATTR